MPWRPSVATSSTVRPSAARARASAAATVVFPVPPLPVTTCRRTEGSGLTRTSVGEPRATHSSQARSRALHGAAGQATCCASVLRMSEPARRRWEYATIPLLIHNTKAILDSWGVDGWELVTVLPGPGGTDQLVAYLKRPA